MTEVASLLIGLVSVSDRASAGVYEDKGIPGLTDWFGAALTTPWRMETRLIPDEQALIERTLIDLVDTVRCHPIYLAFPASPSPPRGCVAIGASVEIGAGKERAGDAWPLVIGQAGQRGDTVALPADGRKAELVEMSINATNQRHRRRAVDR